MEPRVTENDLALLLLDEDDLLTLGAMLSLPARSVDLGEENENEDGAIAAFGRGPTSKFD